MIIDTINKLNYYSKINKNFEAADKFLKENDISGLEVGRYEIDGKNIFLNIDEYYTKDINESFPEAHRNYIDIQIVINGREKIGYTNIDNGIVKIKYNPDKDIEFFSGECNYITAQTGYCFIFFPDDIHHPCITDLRREKVKKAVFKIKI